MMECRCSGEVAEYKDERVWFFVAVGEEGALFTRSPRHFEAGGLPDEGSVTVVVDCCARGGGGP
jgi:hypothetical protein